jgi:hypothetical protein
VPDAYAEGGLVAAFDRARARERLARSKAAMLLILARP